MAFTPPPTGPASPPGCTIRRLRPEDAAGVAECCRRIYGDSYVHPELYHPDQIVQLNQAGALVSAVALDAGGQVVGHYALERPDLGVLAETGEAMVLPEHRHHQLMEQMRVLLEGEAERLGLTGLFGHVVTNHPFSQRIVERFGETACAVSLGRAPRSFHNLPEPLPQRMSELLYFKYLRRPARVIAHVPDHHRGVCDRLYRQLGVPADYREPKAAEGEGQLSVECHPELGRGMIWVRRVGAGTAAEISRARRALAESSGAEAIFLELPLAQAGMPEVCRAVEKAGFFFSGIGPCFAAEGDALLLQWLGVKLDVALLQIESPFARDLVAYVAQERERIGSAGNP